MTVDEDVCAGWPVLILRSDIAEATVLPGKGADVLSFHRLAEGLNLLWRTPWGLRPRGSLSAATNSEGRLMEGYPGGIQTVFPNGGDPATTQNTTWGMHGEVWLAPFEVLDTGTTSVTMVARLVHSPFTVTKRIAVEGPRLTIEETVTCTGGHEVDVMWGHHPALGAPLLAEGAVVSTTARSCLVERNGVLTHADVDAHGWRIPGPDAGVSAMAYLTDFPDVGAIEVRNEPAGVGVRLEWDTTVMPYAWYWLEAGGTTGFPWYGRAYVLGIEPATSLPEHGLASAHATGTAVTFKPHQTRTARTTVTVTD